MRDNFLKSAGTRCSAALHADLNCSRQSAMVDLFRYPIHSLAGI